MAQQHRLRILLVDDDDVMRRVLLAVFSPVAEAQAVGSAVDARAVLESFHPDLVISDDGMPSESGTTFLAGLACTHPQVRRVLFSAAEPEDLAGLVRAGTVQVFVHKPATVDELLALLDDVP